MLSDVILKQISKFSNVLNNLKMGVSSSKSSSPEYENLRKSIEQLHKDIEIGKRNGFSKQKISLINQQLEKLEKNFYLFKLGPETRHQRHKLNDLLQKIKKQIELRKLYPEGSDENLPSREQNNKELNFSNETFYQTSELDTVDAYDLKANEEINFSGPNSQIYIPNQDNNASANFENPQNRDSREANFIDVNEDTYYEDEDEDENDNEEETKRESQNEEFVPVVAQYQQTTEHKDSFIMDTNEKNKRSSQNEDTPPETQKIAEDPEELQILDVHQYFQEGGDISSIDKILDVEERIEAIVKFAKDLESKVNTFKGIKFSLDYFVLDEKLMQLIEKLDKIKSDINSDTTKNKLRVIKYINRLQAVLDANAEDDD